VKDSKSGLKLTLKKISKKSVVYSLQNAIKNGATTSIFGNNSSSSAIPTSRLKNHKMALFAGLLRNSPEHSNPEAKLCAIPTRLYLAL
jgi:hypothetical protein